LWEDEERKKKGMAPYTEKSPLLKGRKLYPVIRWREGGWEKRGELPLRKGPRVLPFAVKGGKRRDAARRMGV